jgi:signal transduction histidine kinase
MKKEAEERELDANYYREELEKANRLLEEKKRELQEANSHLNELYNSRLLFTRTTSHELRNILSAIGGAVKILEKNPAEPTRKEMIGILQRGLSDMESLLDQLQDYSRVMAGTDPVKIETFDLQKMLVEMNVILSPIVRAKGIDLELDLDPDLKKIESDRLKVRRIVNNLLSNAINYTQNGKVKLQTRSVSPDEYLIAVEDTGPGIEPESQERIFEEFQRAASSAGVRGTGLGLTITKRLAETLGGHISVASELGKGSRFEVVLPKSSTV